MSEPVPGVVSLVLPCYQAEVLVGDAVASLTRQTYPHLEILALDDGSTDGTRARLRDLAARDPRVRVLTRDENRGLIPTLNQGVAEARGQYIARMDADDVARPGRLERQVAFLEAHPDVDVLGSAADLIDAGGIPMGRLAVRCTRPEAARFMVAFATPLIHPTLMARAGIMKTHPYGVGPRALHTEDYELFSRMAAAGVRLANLPEALLARRVHEESVSQLHEALQVENFVACAARHLAGVLHVHAEAGAQRVLVNRMGADTRGPSLAAGLRLLDELEGRFLEAGDPAAGEIRGVADDQRVDIFVQALRRGSPSVRLTAIRLLPRYARRLTSPRSRGYLAAKLRDRMKGLPASR
jgi:Glycosyl transferase family 2